MIENNNLVSFTCGQIPDVLDGVWSTLVRISPLFSQPSNAVEHSLDLLLVVGDEV